MKNNLDNTIRESLKDFEMPYDPAAWEALSAKLDAQATPIEGAAKSGLYKWLLTGALVGAVGVGSYLLWPESPNEVTQKEPLTTEANKTLNEKTDKVETEEIRVSNPSENDVHQIEQSSKVEVTERNEDTPQQNVENRSVENKGDVDNTSLNSTILEGEDYRGKNIEPPVEKNKTNYISGNLSFDVVCKGDNAVVTNQGTANDVVRFNFNDEWIVLKQGQSFSLKPETSFVLTFVDKAGEEIERRDVKVYDSPSANFGFEANIFEKGLPIVICEAYGDYASYVWTFDGEEKEDKSEVSHHFFEKGDYNVSLKVVDRNGCENTLTKTIQIHEKYNLMAVDAFKPNSPDPRSRTFMPYSLTEREVKFHLTIVDPINNEVVFESSDAKNTWDGVHQRTGVMTPRGKAYVWKVQIFNSLPNERPIYKGTIIHD